MVDWFGRNARTEVRPLQGPALHHPGLGSTFTAYSKIDDGGVALTIAAGSGPAALTAVEPEDRSLRLWPRTFAVLRFLSAASLAPCIRTPLTRLLFVANWLSGPLSFLHLSTRTSKMSHGAQKTQETRTHET